MAIKKKANDNIHKDMEKWNFLCATSGNVIQYIYYAKEDGESKNPKNRTAL